MKSTRAFIFWLICCAGPLLAGAQSIAFNFRNDLFRIQDFNASLQEGAEGMQLMVTALDKAGNKDLKIEGAYTFVLNRIDTVSLEFHNGSAFYPYRHRGETLLLKYVILEKDPETGFQKAIYTKSHLFRFQEKRGTIESHTIPLWLSILPPLLAIFLALLIKEVISSLFAGIWLGALILYRFRPEDWLNSIFRVIDTYVLDVFKDSGHVSVIIFSLLIGGMVGIVSRNGGMAGIVQRLSRFANSARNTQLITWLMGIAIFFDDYANTLIVGNTMRPVTDRFRISREKLAYLVDSTAAPVSALAFVTTWIGAELGYIGTQSAHLGITESPYSIFFHSLPYAFYPILTLIFIFMLVRTKRDYGSMYHAEMRARQENRLYETPESQREEAPVDDSLRSMEPVEGIRYRWQNAFYPIVTVIVVTIAGLLYTGYDPAIWHSGKGFLTKLSETIGQADSYVALLWSSLSGTIVAIALSVATKTLSFRYSIETMIDGIKTMLPAILILVLAWSLASVTETLHTAEFLTSAMGGSVNPYWMPFIAFLLAAVISFSTGSSWSTMAILYPIALPTSWVLSTHAGLSHQEAIVIYYNVVAVVLGGSVFGDHCSPISDTTVMSSLASSCNHIDHVRTQMPYALTVAVVSLGIGTVFVYIGLPWWLNFAVAAGILYLILRMAGRPVPDYRLPADQNG